MFHIQSPGMQFQRASDCNRGLFVSTAAWDVALFPRMQAGFCGIVPSGASDWRC